MGKEKEGKLKLKIKKEYVTGDLSLTAIAKKHKLVANTVKRWSVEEGWVEQRSQYRARVWLNAKEQCARDEAKELAVLMRTTDKAIERLAELFNDKDQFNRYLVTQSMDGSSETQELIFKKTDTKALKEAIGSIKELTALQRDYYNIPTPAQKEAQRIAAERLEMDKRKAAAEEEDDNTIEVVMRGLEDYTG